MCALVADRNVLHKDGRLLSGPLAANVNIYQGALVCVNAAGYLIPAADNAANLFVGVAAENADNTGGALGAIQCRVWISDLHRLPISGAITIANVGDVCYVIDDEFIGLAALAVNDVPVGIITGIDADPAFAWVDINPSLRVQAVGPAAERNFFRIKAASATNAGVGCAAATEAGVIAEANNASNAQISLTTAGGANDDAYLISPAFDLVRVAHNPTFKCLLTTGAAILAERIWAALTTGDLSGAAQPAQSFVGFRYDSVVGANWMFCLSEAANFEEIDTGIPVVAATEYLFVWTRSAAGAYNAYINGALVAATAGVHPPAAATELGYQVDVSSIADAVAKSILFSLLSVEFGGAI